jgi:formiminotetrahydrofolate cyclodeaminase
MTELVDRPLRRLLADVAAPTPAPGGGCSLAWACALAAGLVEMSAAIAGAQQLADQAQQLRADAVTLGEQELDAYEPVLAALRLPREDPQRPERLDQALSEAAETPLALARVAAALTALAADTMAVAHTAVSGDASAGLLLAEASCQAAARLVQINLCSRPQDARLAEVEELTERSARARAQLPPAARS